jgi:DNA-binding Xre family transcriptional regulator
MSIRNSISENRDISENGNVSLRIKEWAEVRGLSLYKLAQDTKIGYPTLHRLANGQTSGIQFDKLRDLATALSVKPSELIQP